MYELTNGRAVSLCIYRSGGRGLCAFSLLLVLFEDAVLVLLMCASPNVMAACYGLTRARPDTSPDNDDSAFSDNASLVSSSSGSVSAPATQRDSGASKVAYE
jgi:hypothetical protein